MKLEMSGALGAEANKKEAGRVHSAWSTQTLSQKKKKLGSRAFSCQECVPGFYPWDWKEQRVKADDVTAPDRKAPSAGEEMETMHPCSLLWGMWTTEWLVLKNIKQHY